MKKIITFYLLIILSGNYCFSQVTGDFRSVTAGGNWDATSSWQTWNGSAWVAAGSLPTSSNNVYIKQADNIVITIPTGYNATCASLTIGDQAGDKNNDLVISGTGTLTVSGNLDFHRPNAGASNDLSIGSGTVTVGGNLSFIGTATNSNRFSKITITTGILNIGVDLILNAPSAATSSTNQIDMSGGAGTLNLGGSFTIAASGGGSLLPGTSSTFNYNGISSGQTVQMGVTNFNYNNLHINNTSVSGATLNGAVTSTNVSGNIRIQSGMLSNGGYTIAMAASKTFEVGNNASFIMTGTTGMATGTSLTKTFGTNSTVRYEGSNQTLSNETYYNLSTSGSGIKTLSGAVTVNGNLTIGSSTTLDVSASNYNINISGNWTNNGTFTAQNGTTSFNGTSQQSIGGTASTVFKNLTVNNSSGVVFTKSQTVGGVLTFSNGTLTTSVANLLTMNAGSSVSGASTTKYIIGPVKKIGNTAFTFPVGKGIVYAPIGISAPANATDAFTAEYIRSNPQGLGTLIFNEQIKQISFCEYWNLNRTTGTSAVNVTLSWSSLSPCNLANYVTNLSAIGIGHFDGVGWDSYGNNGGTTGNVSAGTVTWNNVSAFSPFTLISTSAYYNPLPVKFSSIRAIKKERGVQIDWNILTELNIDHYEIERSADQQIFTTAGQQAATGNNGTAVNYSWLDTAPLAGNSFYRIKAVDKDGKNNYSTIVKNSPAGIDDQIILYPNPATGGSISIQGADLAKGNYFVKVFNRIGVQIMNQNLNHSGGAINQSIQFPVDIKPGIYSIQLMNDGVRVMNKTFMVQ